MAGQHSVVLGAVEDTLRTALWRQPGRDTGMAALVNPGMILCHAAICLTG